MASTREGAELLTQYGWESRWTTRTERWPLVEDRATLLEVSMDETRSESAYSMASNRFELGSPVSNLDFIAEEHFQLGKPGKSWSRSISDTSGEKSDDKDKSDRESGIHIPGVQTSFHFQDSRTYVGRAKSQTMPSDTSNYRKYQSLPMRSQTLRSVSMSPSKLAQDRTQSVEHLTDRKLLNLDLGPKDRSRSLNLDVLSSNKESSSNVKTNEVIEKSVINKAKTAKVSPLTITIGDDGVDCDDSKEDETKEIDSKVKADIDETSDFKLDSLEDSTDGQSSVLKTDIVVKSAESKTVVTAVNSSSQDSVAKDNSSALEMHTVENSSETAVEKVNSSIGGVESVDKASVIKSEQNQMISISITDTDNEVHMDSNFDISGNTENQGAAGGSDANLNSSGSSEISQNSDNRQIVESKQSKSLDGEESQEGLKKNGSLKEERSSSSESSRTSKSRADSFNTDSTTSGIGSYDSGHQGVTELHTLTPIPSSTSLENLEVKLRPKDAEAKERAHHSVALRRLSNLSRVPSTRRQSSPGVGLLPISKFFDFSENAITYTTARDAIGYATLRSLMKQRQISSDAESDYGLNNLYDTSSIASTSRRPSIDSTHLDSKRPLRLVF